MTTEFLDSKEMHFQTFIIVALPPPPAKKNSVLESFFSTPNAHPPHNRKNVIFIVASPSLI